MISNVHKAVICEIKEGQPRPRIINDLIISFTALAINELKHCKQEAKQPLLDYLNKQLEFSQKLINDCGNGDDPDEALAEILEEAAA